jgi:hypothetical protein
VTTPFAEVLARLANFAAGESDLTMVLVAAASVAAMPALNSL